MESVIEEPLPVFYRLRSILEIFKPQYFEDVDVDYDSIKGDLEEYLKVWNEYNIYHGFLA